MNVSVIIPTYNYASFIAKAIQSALNQNYTYGSIEIFVIDDGSTDSTAEKVAPFVAAGQVQYLWQANAGKASATKAGIERAKGDVIFLLDADDYFLPNKILDTISLFQRYSSVVHVATPAALVASRREINDTIEPIPDRLLERQLPGHWLLRYFLERKMLYGGGSTFAARGSVLKSIPLPKEVDMYTDEWLVLQVLLRGNSWFLNKPLSVWNIHGANYSQERSSPNLSREKHQRLHASSQGVLQALQQANYPNWLQSLYALKHAVRIIGWKEAEGTKTWQDRLQFCIVILKYPYPLICWWYYRIPLRIFR